MSAVVTVELDDRLRTLRGGSAEIARELRAHALAVDADPGDMKPHLDMTAYRMIRQSSTPPEYTDGPIRIGRYAYAPGSCLEQVICAIELGYGDAATLLACPGPALAGVLVDKLGNAAQRERFHSRLADGATWAFFAMTEPGRGNDASEMQAALVRESPELYRLHGTKRYIGNGSRGAIGVVFARTGRSPLSIRAALVETPAEGFQGTSLDMVGLRGARLSEIELDGMPVAADMLLGQELPVSRRGLWAAMRCFNNMRAQVSGLAVGTGLAIVDLVRAERPGAPGAEELAGRLEACRQLVHTAAATVDRDLDAGHLSSTAKIAATRLGREASRWAARVLGPAAAVQHPLLEKWSRDVCAFEFMEGTTNIQRAHVAKSYLKGVREA